MGQPRYNCLNGAENNMMKQGSDQNEILGLECRLIETNGTFYRTPDLHNMQNHKVLI
jgi:hypothetical protein